MIDLPLGKLFEAMNQIATFSQVAEFQVSNHSGIKIDHQNYALFVERVNEFIRICGAIGLHTTQLAAKDFCVALNSGQKIEEGYELSLSNLLGALGGARAIQNCLKYESALKVGLILSATRVELFTPKSPLFGVDVVAKFPSIAYEIEEAGKCLALGRSTATVFHLMRIMETALRSVHFCLNIQTPLIGNNKNWGNILVGIKKDMDNRGKAWAEIEYFNEIYVMVVAVKNAWRNTTMHVEKIYTEEQASVLFDIVNEFMKKIASRMDENGQPTA